jgi:hypothetical protein
MAVQHALKSVPLTVLCESCKKPVALTTVGLAGVASYPTYNQFFCPHCRKLNTAKTDGSIATVDKG